MWPSVTPYSLVCRYRYFKGTYCLTGGGLLSKHIPVCTKSEKTPMLIFTTEKTGSNDNPSGLYSIGAWYEYLSGYWLSWLSFAIFLSAHTDRRRNVIKWGTDNTSVFWDIIPCSPLKVNRRFARKYNFLLQGSIISRARNQRESKRR
jgi:hypothetical protein